MTKKQDYQKLEKKLIGEKKSCWELWDEKIKKEAFDFAEKYKIFLDKAKTERESVLEGVKMAKEKGFKDIGAVKSLKAGDKVFAINKNKALMMAVIGKKSMKEGFRMLMSHIDSPHLDLKISPLYEEESLAFFKTHYYGGIKKYQWPTITLALHGVVCLDDGKEINFVIGEKDTDPIFMITDLLPHLDRGVLTPKREVLGEDLNLLLGSIPVNDKKIKEKVKLAVLEYLFNNYGIKQGDFASAEIQAVPSNKARDLGFDRSMVSAYGHDDRICSFVAIEAFLNTKVSNQTQICAWVDREEIGSDGQTGAISLFFEKFISNLLELGGEKSNMSEIINIFDKSKAISTDVTVAVDPDYKEVHDLRNAHRMGYGIAMEKYTGSGGKYSTSEASAEYVAELRGIMKRNKNIVCQFSAGLGKVDQGGGGTIAKFMANRGIDIVDMGIPLFNMHAPLEIASKADLYSAYLFYKEFYLG
ncbi:aminopeptidase [Candidatus Falkowbacteria bacterium RIFOXYB2_FULL_34_18]|uniref:M18 family aminopeptidase n=1 Tax=Candidatus Falkowbacteria bacterium RIFOXYD2_FULL_34_120 TaxID=1798007 RepID=A0A1F5TLV0_9BACT|nr:MAG: aminopeptidase [Candidatus Falkowbacteria bacterium RIFOXYB2_FULL_34_18]OGF29157.1 MAG: aminopeptidase [Candidatus Falkowbacteria bacterium RIFOXYC12_FULL_34_55]OGF36963.1 MAG: aminopeptidase [Candidatus Falkowbacteria bacterium RIFOXYC2_FULL_34_220]OGF38679.1 MAG: aminopeptidase [Candidatus Falkowbacteria bacterium RIFOXYD12_FULL_34_57]OGF39913.1 MAG: aminopeptidase [Candidatus Falkowbacteria bacterium RIFOXYD2_FULL_34_120]